jgi:hypothetical protein
MTSNHEIHHHGIAHSIIGNKISKMQQAAAASKTTQNLSKKNTMMLQDSGSVTNFDASAG